MTGLQSVLSSTDLHLQAMEDLINTITSQPHFFAEGQEANTSYRLSYVDEKGKKSECGEFPLNLDLSFPLSVIVYRVDTTFKVHSDDNILLMNCELKGDVSANGSIVMHKTKNYAKVEAQESLYCVATKKTQNLSAKSLFVFYPKPLDGLIFKDCQATHVETTRAQIRFEGTIVQDSVDAPGGASMSIDQASSIGGAVSNGVKVVKDERKV